MLPENKPTPEQNVYQTGNTETKKSHSGLFAILIVAVILLISVVSVIGLLNIQLFRQATEADPDGYAFRVTQISSLELPTQPEQSRETPDGVPQLQLQPAPQTVSDSYSLQELYSQNIDSVVSVSGKKGSGSGVVITDCGYLVTDSSLLGDSQTARIRFHDGSRLTAQVVGIDTLTGLAVLDAEAENLKPVTFCDDAALQVGDPVIAIGDPLGPDLPGTMTYGFLSAINRDLEVNGRSVSLLQSTATAGEGNTGGPLFNRNGQVVGINCTGLGNLLNRSRTKALSLAVPSSLVKEIVDQLLAQGYVSRQATLGFTVEQVSPFDQLYYKVPAGLYITSADPDTQLQPGDILLSFAGQRVGDTDALRQLLRSYRPGDTVKLTIDREGSRLVLQLTLKESE